MEAKQNKGQLMKAFRKVALVGTLAAASLGLGGCVTTGGFVSPAYNTGAQFGSPVYGQANYQNNQTGYGVSYTPPRAPWANDPGFRQQVATYMQLANSEIRSEYADYQTRASRCDSRYASNLNRNSRQIQRDRRDGFSLGDALNTGTRMNATQAQYNQCRIQAQASFQRAVLSEQQSFDRQVENLNRTYARKYGVRW